MSNEIVVEQFSRAEDRTPAAPAAPESPMAMVARAVQTGMDPATIKALMDLQERHAATEARKAYNAAFNAFKAEAVRIVRSTPVTDGPLKGKKYADKYAIVSAVTGALSRHGLSASWRLTKDEKDWMEVTCTLRHVLGHAEQVSMGGPPDTGPGRNAIQARSSTNSYLEKITLKAICGLAESGDDDDGRGGKGAKMPEKALADWLTAIAMAETMEQADAVWAQILTASTEAGDINAHEQLRGAMLKRRKEIKTKGETK
jgi:hypothetical protein